MSFLLRKPTSGGICSVPLTMLSAATEVSSIPTAPFKPKNQIVMTPAKTPEVKKGRMTKAETLKAEKAAIMGSLAAFAESKPTKKDVKKYFEARLSELRTK
jgi:hypothetical protein